jgi:peptide-methionine (R)-S-oxide reductase
MISKLNLLILIMLILTAVFLTTQSSDISKSSTINSDSAKNSKVNSMENKIVKTEEEWQKELTPEEYHVLREKGTERAFTGEYDHFFEEGVYKCAACGNELFSSVHKYDSGCGWPAYWTALAKDKVTLKEDRSFGMVRTEVLCAKCGSHLGHVFDDGPEPTGQRYCINSVSLDFVKKEK